MYDKFTDRARKVMQLANEEANLFGHEYIGTEHILLGLVKEGNGVAANALKNLKSDLVRIRAEVGKIVLPGNKDTREKLPLTPRAKRVIEYTIEEARKLNHNYPGTEHLLLGLLREEEGVAAQVLMNLGLKLEDVRDEVLDILGYPKSSSERCGRRRAKEYDVFLPLHSVDGTPVEADKIENIARRLHDHFGGVVRSKHRHEGVCRSEGVAFQKEIVILRVVALDDLKGREFLTRFQADLKSELGREDILIVVRDIEIL